MIPNIPSPKTGAFDPGLQNDSPQDRAGIFMDCLQNIIRDLNAREELQEIFGTPVSRGLVVVADGGDLRIEEAGRVPLVDGQRATFLEVLDQVIRQNSG